MDTPNLPIIFTRSKVKLEQTYESIGEWDTKQDILNGECRSCFGIANLKKMTDTYFHEGKAEIYSEMLMFCFSIQFEEIDKDNDLNFICEVCIRRLRDAADFKRQLEDAQSALKNLLDVQPIANFTLPDDDGSVRNEDTCDGIDFQETVDIQTHITENLPGVTVKRLNRNITRRTERERSPNHIKGQNRAAVLSVKYASNNSSKIRKENVKRKKPERRSEALPFELNTTDLKCKICNAEFLWIRNLKMHMSVHYPNHVCETCGHLSATRKQLYRHSYTHSKTLWPCTLCPDKKYKTLTALQVHTKVKHLGGMTVYKCPLCDERFNNFPQRRKHLVAVHNYRDMKYGCKLCEKEFKTVGALSAHVRIVHIKERRHTCTVCEQGFFAKKSLAHHMLCHSSERNFPCQYCEKRFKRKYTLTEHEKIHTGEKKHVCNLCGKAFTQKASLKGHISVHDHMRKSNFRK